MRLRNPKYLLLLILPVVYLIFTGIFLSWRPFYTIGADPIYIYLSTGMNMAGSSLKISYIDNPGVPVQCFCATLIYIKHLFNHGIPLYQDVLLHPESYLYMFCVIVALIYALATFYTGYYLLKRTENISLALLFQLTPLIGSGILTTGSPSPETFYIISGMFFVAYLYYNTIIKPGIKWRQIAVYGIFTGFFVACKYICFPLIFLVLFTLPTVRSKIRYLFSFAFFLLVFMAPALPVWDTILRWLMALATHKGHYGQGEEGFVSSSDFKSNLKTIFTTDVYFTVLYIVLIASLIIALVKRKTGGEKGKANLRLLAGVGVSSVVLILLVAKHYSFHYLMPIQLCYPLIIAGFYGVLRNDFKLFENKLVPRVVFYTFFVLLTYTQLKTYLKYPPRQIPPATADFLDKYHGVPIIMDVELESARLEPAIYIGVSYARDFRNTYCAFLRNAYPDAYQYKESQSIGRWDDVYYTPELFSKSPKVLIYFKSKDSNTRYTALHNLAMWGTDTIAHFHLAYSFKEREEYVYELEGNQNLAKQLMAKYRDVNFDLEKLTPDKSKALSADGKDTVTVGGLSNKEHHSGSNSVLMNDSTCQYTLNYMMRAYPGSLVDASIWTKSPDGFGGLVFISRSSGDFYVMGHAVIDSDGSGWKKIEYKCLVPPSIKDSSVLLYMYYYGRSYAYYDDLSVRIYPMEKE